MDFETVIHIGYHKTASTYLQKRIFPELDVNFVFLEQKFLQYVAYDSRYDPVHFRHQIRQRGKLPNRPYLISQEALRGHPHGYDSVDPFVIAERLQAAFPQARIFCMVREQIDYMLSLYAFRVSVKGFESRPLVQFLTEEGARGILGHVLVLPWEMLRDNQIAFLQAIYDFLNLKLNDRLPDNQRVNDSTRSISVLRVNSSLNKLSYPIQAGIDRLHLFQVAKVYRTRYHMFKRWLLPILNKLLNDDEQIQMPEAIITEIRPTFQISNTELSRLIGIDLSQYGYLSDF